MYLRMLTWKKNPQIKLQRERKFEETLINSAVFEQNRG